MLVRYRVVLLAVLFTVMPQRASFPCESAPYSTMITSPWDWVVARIGPSFRVFVAGGYAPDYSPSLTLYRDGVLVHVDLVPVDLDALSQVADLAVLAPSTPLEPGRYCTAHYEDEPHAKDAWWQPKSPVLGAPLLIEDHCVVVDVGLTADDSNVSASIQAIATTSRCFNEDSDAGLCASSGSYEVNLRWSEVTLSNVDEALSALVANWLIELRPDDGTPWEAARGELLRDHIDNGVETLYTTGLTTADRLCARLSAVLWDGTVLPPHDAGCDDF